MPQRFWELQTRLLKKAKKVAMKHLKKEKHINVEFTEYNTQIL